MSLVSGLQTRMGGVGRAGERWSVWLLSNRDKGRLDQRNCLSTEPAADQRGSHTQGLPVEHPTIGAGRYTLTAQALHWLTVFLILMILPA